VVKLAVWVAGRNSYREAEETLRRVGRVFMSASRIWHYTNAWAEALCQQQAEEQAQANAVPSREQPQPGEAKHDTHMGVSLDGWMVNLIEEGWKEVKSGTCYEVVMDSGSIESGCKHFQARLKRAGMRWSRPGAERMLALRSSVMSNYFDAHWETLLALSPQK
jgi:hypothetical protein